MRSATQVRLAIGAAILGGALFIGANAHLIAVAFQSQPDCVLAEGSPAPAKRAC